MAPLLRSKTSLISSIERDALPSPPRCSVPPTLPPGPPPPPPPAPPPRRRPPAAPPGPPPAAAARHPRDQRRGPPRKAAAPGIAAVAGRIDAPAAVGRIGCDHRTGRDPEGMATA